MTPRSVLTLVAVVGFLFGAVVGATLTFVAGRGGQVKPDPHATAAPAPPADSGPDEAELRHALAIHEALLVDRPDDPRLLRTVGNYHAMLGRHDDAAVAYARAEVIHRAGDDPDAREFAGLLFDQAMVEIEHGRLLPAVRRLEEASDLDPGDVRSRLAQIYVHLVGFMRELPPGMERRDAVARAEVLIEEVLAIDPHDADALQFRHVIASVRSASAQAAAAAAAAAAGDDGAAP